MGYGQVEQVIKEQNMFDVFVAIEGYCNLLIERLNLLEKERFVRLQPSFVGYHVWWTLIAAFAYCCLRIYLIFS